VAHARRHELGKLVERSTDRRDPLGLMERRDREDLGVDVLGQLS
jgi:hypothetical protein